MSYKSPYVDDSLMEDVFNKLNRLGKYASRQELLDEVRDLNLELERERKMLETYRHRYETKQSESSHLSKNLDTVRDYQQNLMKEHRDLEDRYNQLRKQNETQKTDIQVLKRELDSKETSYFLNRRRFLDGIQDDKWLLREYELEKSVSPKYKYWHWRPYLYRYYRDLYDKYYPYTSYDPSWYYSYYDYPYSSYYSRYYSPYSDRYLWRYPWRNPVSRKMALEDRMESIQQMTADLKLNNSKMLKDLKTVRSSAEY